MNRHYKPMLAQSAEAPFNSKDWIFEVKWDGIRAISYVDDDLSIRSRNDKELRYNFPELEELKNLATNAVLDGEIIVMKAGSTDFQKLIERSKVNSQRDIEYMSREFPATYVVFDILETHGKPLINLPLIERKSILKENLREGKHVTTSLFVEEEGEIYYQEALKKGVEGIMAKKKDSPYTPGMRSDNWLKIKKLLSCDCVIFGYTAGEGNREETFGALVLGLYERDKPAYVGKVGTGFSLTSMKHLMELFRRLETQEKTLEGVDASEKVTWLKPELVCEIVYQTVTKDNRLRMPRFHVLRPDKSPLECTLDQIRQNSLPEYTAKRDFTVTPEPKVGAKATEGQVFVVQEHHARRLHYDLRLEKEGVLKSWAVPKGIPEKAGDKRLAVHTEDHPLEYANFEGTIPAGQYGAGTVKIWDRGTFDVKLWKEDMVEFTLKGDRLRGKYVLTKFKKAGDNDWLLLRMKD
ncbi:MAG: non-homologous end-joining DNA ligase [Candidatus Bathyarchaeia archaeon]|jgi:DNA ligase D-like protein (predicted ligase)/DNA ligase D-like protein (predicted 3'-phosphoesterase)